ncbi:MAG: glycoside hydrolase family 3 N-terminal domain-containing protein [Acidobacteriota bacterium]
MPLAIIGDMKSPLPVLVLCFTVACCSVSRAQSPRLDKEAQDWVTSIFDKMTLDEKIGQLIIGGTNSDFTNVKSDKFQQIRSDITRYHVGGYHAFGGELLSAAFLIRRMQELASVPLLITADMEGGTGLIFRGGTRFPRAMALGATFDPENARRVGRMTAMEARSIGVHVNFYPVVDVNNNPLNPIINIRSFGEDPQRVSDMAVAYVEGFQETGLIATAKHFPGHGDTSRDSHLQLPVIPVSRERLDQVELLPFQKVIQAGVRAVMTAHLVIPALEPQPNLPATLSRRISTGLLKEEMGFEGLIVTDAMNMGGLRHHYGDAEAAVLAFSAGADLILFPLSIGKAFRGLRDAVRQGRISADRLNLSVQRILQVKASLGLHQGPRSYLSAIDQQVGAPEQLKSSQRIMDRAITLVRDEKDVLPFTLGPKAKVLLVTVLDERRPRESRGAAFAAEFLIRHRQTEHVEVLPDVSEEKIESIRKLAEDADFVVVGIYIRTAANKGEFGLSPNEMTLLEIVSRNPKPAALVVFGSPYLLSLISHLPTYIVAYDDHKGAELAAVKSILGEISFRGKLPVSLPDLYPVGHGITR